MASGSQFMTTYYAKRIMGDNAASTADQALLQTGYGITVDTWILNRTNRPNYGILYHYDSNGTDKIKFIGGINNTSDIETAWIQLDAGDTYILGRVGIGQDPTVNNNPYKLYINGTTYANAPVYINNSTAVAMEDDNGALVIGDKAGLNIGIDNCKVHARNNSAAANLLLNSEGGNILLGVDDDDYYVNIRSEQDASSTSTGALRVGGGAGITKKLYVGDDIHSDGHLYFAAAKNIYMNYNGIDYPILENSDDSNIILNAATGILNIGHKNTIGINMYYSTNDSTRTQFFTINSNGAYANTRFGVNGQDTNYTLYVNGTGYLEDDLYIQGANNGIYFVGTQATYQMIKFIDNSSDAYGNGISIGGGGQTIIGGGESANTAAAQVGTSGSEIMYVCNDGNVDIISNLQNGWDSRKIMTLNTSGYLMLPSYINSPTSNSENPTVSQFIVTNGSDHYYRKASTAHAMAAIRGAASGSWGISITGNAESATKLQTARSLWGNSFNGTADISGALKLGSTTYANGYIELYGGTPYIDFHFGSSTADYTSRIIENVSGQLYISGKLKIATSRNGYALNTASFICDSWVRTVGSAGWYNESYGGGWYMTDSTWIRSYGSKKVYVNNVIMAPYMCANGESTAYNLYVNGTGYFVQSCYFANGTTYYVNGSGHAVFNSAKINSYLVVGSTTRTTSASEIEVYYNNVIGARITANANSGFAYHIFNTSGTETGRASRSSGAWGTVSSREVKHDIVPLLDVGAQVDALVPVSFKYKEGDQTTQLGLIYEDTIDILPEICEDAEGTKTINYSALTPVLLRELQSLRKRVKQLEELLSKT